MQIKGDDSIDYAALGEAVRQTKRKRGHTGDQLAVKFQCSPTTVSTLINGHTREMKAIIMLRACKYIRRSPMSFYKAS